jgi:hypothetical protein
MSTVSRTMSATPEQVWDVLADGWSYPLWVVGAARIRDVDPSWPKTGARLHHSVGVWPLLLNDDTEVIESLANQVLRLRPNVWALGAAEVTITLSAVRGGTEVQMREAPVQGPGVLVPAPLITPLLDWRNHETLRRMSYLTERRPSSGRLS